MQGYGQQHTMAPPAPPQSQVVCGGCRTLLMYPQGAQNVRCARCGHITPGGDTAQINCMNAHCGVTLMYPRGASQVQCSLCGTLNPAQQANALGHVVCGGCRVTLMYAHGAHSVKCAVCNHVTGVGAGPSQPPPPPQQQQYHPHHHHQQQQQQQQQTRMSNGSVGSSRPTQAVLVENPPSLDEAGNEVQNMALGVTARPDYL